MTLRPAAFIDRDGVINVERDYVWKPADFELLPGVPEALRRFADHGFALVVVTNQAGIAKGRYTEADYERLTNHMRSLLEAQGVTFDGVYHCPHHPHGSVERYQRVCDCRKPAPGMLLRAAHELQLDLARSVMVGDKTSDTDAGRAAGVRSTVVVESGHALADDAILHADHRCASLVAASVLLCKDSA